MTSTDGIAFIDESEAWNDVDPGTYLLAASIIREGREDVVRAAAAALRRPGQSKAHWHDERTVAGRLRLVRAVSDASLDHLVVVRAGAVQSPAERCRRLCLERMWFELQERGVAHVVLESRGPGDRHDRKLLEVLRARKQVQTITIDHMKGPQEPLLWIPDIVCGTVNQHRRGISTYLDMIRPRTMLIEI